MGKKSGKDRSAEDSVAEQRQAVIEKATQQAEALQRKFDESYVVAKGCAVTTRRGVRSAGDVVVVVDLGGGKASFDSLVKSGYLVKAKS